MPKKSEDTKKEKSAKKKLSDAEFKKKVVELAGKGLTSEKIGEALRKEGIHPKEHGQKISSILKEEGKYIIPDVKNTEEKLEKLRSHFEANKQDKRAMRERDRIAARLRTIKGYHKVA